EAVAVDRHVEVGVAERGSLLLLARLAPDEFVNVGMVDVEHDHLRRAARLATGLDGAGPRVSTAHERHRAAREAALRPVLLGATDVREVDPGARPAAEDLPFLGVPLENRFER